MERSQWQEGDDSWGRREGDESLGKGEEGKACLEILRDLKRFDSNLFQEVFNRGVSAFHANETKSESVSC